MGRLWGGRADQAARRNDERWRNSLPQGTYGYGRVGRGSAPHDAFVYLRRGAGCAGTCAPGGAGDPGVRHIERLRRSEEHTSELQSLMRSAYAVLRLKKKNHDNYLSY